MQACTISRIQYLCIIQRSHVQNRVALPNPGEATEFAKLLNGCEANLAGAQTRIAVC